MSITHQGVQARVLSRYQRRIIEFVRYGSGNGVVRATAGAGKTSTLVEVAKVLPPNSRACFLAFGREAAEELGRRLPPGIPALTVHRLGRKTLEIALSKRMVRLRRVERGKYRRLARRVLAEAGRPAATGDSHPSSDGANGGVRPLSARSCAGRSKEEHDELESYLLALTQHARLSLCDCADGSALSRLALRYSLVPPSSSELEASAHELLGEVVRKGLLEAWDDGIIDFTDMLYAPVALGLPPPRFDFVCVDEAQDYSQLALAFTLRLVNPAEGSRLLFVGDPSQSIYGFAGADSRALERIEATAQATTLPLSISYRCPRSHVELASMLTPEIEAGADAKAGRIFWITDLVLEYWARPGDLILCRANAPLVRTCLRLVRAGVRAFVLGRNLARQLAGMARQLLPHGNTDAQRNLDAFAASERARLGRALTGRPDRQLAIAERIDLIECLRSLVANQPTGDVELLVRAIESAFAEGSDAVTLSTVHRAKGKEADRVFILYPELMPAPYARTEEAARGETCVQFVALTRARRDLVFVAESGSGKRSAAGPDEYGDWSRVLALARRLSNPRDELSGSLSDPHLHSSGVA